MSWHVSPWVYPVWDSLRFLDLIDYFLSHFGDVFNYISSNIFSDHFFFSSSSRMPIIQMLVHLMLSQRSLRLPSILFILFCLFGSATVISTLYLPAHLSVLLSQLFCYRFLLLYFNFSYCVVHYCLFDL